eukprot:TRINITY_DN1438_c0_g1_i1.p1 TRINITY_DN1438_c0_g1~~TRINITY_DN1438_c0_g1_i1.p1  ORF type:complete len:1073 (-),score=214.42 TRINITY_DN1438_c0_g1_i1:13-3231(-)
MSKVSLLLHEIRSITSAMRTNQRWINYSSKQSEMDQLFVNFLDLEHVLSDCSSMEEIDSFVYLKPIIVLLESGVTTGPIAGVVLGVISNVLSFGVLSLDSVNAMESVRKIAESVMNFRFEHTDSVNDEVVHLRILRILSFLLTGPVGSLLSNQLALDSIVTFYKMRTQNRLSVILRKNAEMNLVESIQFLSNKFKFGPDSVFTDEMKDELMSEYLLYTLIRYFISEASVFPKNGNQYLPLLAVDTILELQADVLSESETILKLVLDDVFKHLFQGIQSKNYSLIMVSTRLCTTLFRFSKDHLKMHIGLYFKFSLSILNDKTVPLEYKWTILDSIYHLMRNSSFSADIILNYDYDINEPDTFEMFIDYLYKQITNSIESKEGELCMEIMLVIMKSLKSKFDTPVVCPPGGSGLNLDVINERKQLKNILKTGAEHFNENFARGFEYLQKKGILPVPVTTESVAKFLKNNPFLSKEAIGEYIGRPKEFNAQVLEEYVKTFPMEGRYIDCLRDFLESFRIPGEAQIIERILDVWGPQYFSRYGGNIFENPDAVFFLSYSVILLNVDQHSPNLMTEDRMTFERYCLTVLDGNNDKEFPIEFIREIFDCVKEEEIKHYELFLSEGLTDACWKYFLKKYKSKEDSFVSTGEYNGYFDSLVFKSIWRKLHAATKYIYSTTKKPQQLELALKSFQLCAAVAQYYESSHSFDSLIVTLCDLSMINSKNVPFGSSSRSQMATIALFTIAHNNRDYLRDSWKNILSCLISLNELELLPDLTTFKNLFEFHEAPKLQESFSFGSFAYNFSSWLVGSPQDENSNIKRQHTNNEIIEESRITDFFLSTKNMTKESLLYWITALISSSVPNEETNISTALFCLDLISEMTLGEETVHITWPLVSNHFKQVISNPKNHVSIIETTVTNSLLICSALLSNPSIHEEVFEYLHLLTRIENPVVHSYHYNISSGFYHIITMNLQYIQENDLLPLILPILQFLLDDNNLVHFGADILSAWISPEDPVVVTYVDQNTFTLTMGILDQFSKKKNIPAPVSEKISELMSIMVNKLHEFMDKKETTTEPVTNQEETQ